MFKQIEKEFKQMSQCFDENNNFLYPINQVSFDLAEVEYENFLILKNHLHKCPFFEEKIAEDSTILSNNISILKCTYLKGHFFIMKNFETKDDEFVFRGQKLLGKFIFFDNFLIFLYFF